MVSVGNGFQTFRECANEKWSHFAEAAVNWHKFSQKDWETRPGGPVPGRLVESPSWTPGRCSVAAARSFRTCLFHSSFPQKLVPMATCSWS